MASLLEGTSGDQHVAAHQLRTVRVACISDTHGKHRGMRVPDADLLIHAGDFTHFGKKRDVEDFNEWLGTLPHRTKIVVNGNHENNSDWSRQAKQVLSNATHLLNETITVRVPLGGGEDQDSSGVDVTIHGTQFYWPMKTRNPYYAAIPRGGTVDWNDT